MTQNLSVTQNSKIGVKGFSKTLLLSDEKQCRKLKPFFSSSKLFIKLTVYLGCLFGNFDYMLLKLFLVFPS